jgi:hypothetical protein
MQEAATRWARREKWGLERWLRRRANNRNGWKADIEQLFEQEPLRAQSCCSVERCCSRRPIRSRQAARRGELGI